MNYVVIVAGSGFGSSVITLRRSERGYRVTVQAAKVGTNPSITASREQRFSP
jgi:hypothetical protein